MKIQTNTSILNIKKFSKYAVNYGGKESSYSNECEITMLVIYNKNNSPFIIISADIIWFSEEIVENCLNEIFKILNINKQNIVFCASHTHGTPNPNKDILYGKYSERFNITLKENLKQLVKSTLSKNKINVSMHSENIKAPNVSINRRKKALQFKSFPLLQTQSLPNDKRQIDNHINIIQIVNNDTDLIECIILKHTCHPVADENKVIGADYPGFLKKYIKESITKNIVFMQGFCGDIRPNVIKNNISIKDKIIKLIIGDRFRKSKNGDSEYISKKIFKSLKYDINSNKTLINGPMRSISKSIKIELENNTLAPRNIEITIWLWEATCFIFVNAEVLSGYIMNNYKNLNIINVGYTNGMFGYLPTEKDILEAGYEVNKSRKYFKINDKLKTNNEAKIKNEIKKMINSLYIK